MRLNSIEALKLLRLDVIENDDELNEPRNNWVRHSIEVGNAAGVIAKHLGLDYDYARALGYIHDIGRKIDHPKHAIEGYYYMVGHGYPEEASICLTHSFIDNNIHLIAGGEVEEGKIRDFIEDYLNSRELSIYDNIIQMCDLLCLPTGITTLEKRLLDIYTRKGIHSNTLDQYHGAIRLKEKLEGLLGCPLYDLFDTIKDEDLRSINEDSLKIKSLLENNRVNILKK